jgi:hypothetical protein
MSEEPRKKESFIYKWPITIAAYLFGRFFGWIFLWPMLGAFATAFVASRLLRPRFRAMVPAISLQGGQVIWLLAGLTIVVGGFLSTTEMSQNDRDSYSYGLVVDAALQAIFIAWIALRPGLLAVISTSLYQVLQLGVGIHDLTKPYITFEDQKGLTIHAILNISIIVMLFVGLHEVRREAQGPVADASKTEVDDHSSSPSPS